MTTRKIILIVVGVVATLFVLVLIFVGIIVGAAFYSIGNSEAANTARTFLKGNEKLKSDIGEVKDFGSFVTGSVNVENDSGHATINLKVIGAKKTVNASVDLVFVRAGAWRVTSASYVNESGQRVTLLDPYDTKKLPPPRFLAAAQYAQ